MKPEDIKNEIDIIAYIDGVLNDRATGVIETPEACHYIIELITFLIKKDRVNQELRRKDITEENKAAWINDQRIRQLEQQQQYPNAEIWQYIHMLEDRIKLLEEK